MTEPKIIPVRKGCIFHSTEAVQYAYNKDAHETVKDILLCLYAVGETTHRIEAQAENPFWKDIAKRLDYLYHSLQDLSLALPGMNDPSDV